GRKMGQNMGRLLRRFFHPVSEFLQCNMDNTDMQEFIVPLSKAFAKLQQSTAMIDQRRLKNPDEAGAASSDYLRQFALVALGYMWARMAKVALEKIATDEGSGKKEFYDSKIQTARFYFERVLPEADARQKMVLSGAKSLMDLQETAF